MNDDEQAPAPTPTVLAEAKVITSGARNRDYGTPQENHDCTATMWNAYLQRKPEGYKLTAQDVCAFNILQKMSRQAHHPKRDNWVDVAGFAANAGECQ